MAQSDDSINILLAPRLCRFASRVTIGLSDRGLMAKSKAKLCSLLTVRYEQEATGTSF
jgi:hypothetical protein